MQGRRLINLLHFSAKCLEESEKDIEFKHAYTSIKHLLYVSFATFFSRHGNHFIEYIDTLKQRYLHDEVFEIVRSTIECHIKELTDKEEMTSFWNFFYTTPDAFTNLYVSMAKTVYSASLFKGALLEFTNLMCDTLAEVMNPEP